ncbi:hypothetical protein BZG02_07280 [Labilibaculum filiforme]|uniref:Uncharacterized protein n=1 Tax=Labilibaculum filiforme TaxID=1940526 RepID=A0A2N3I0G9_9BACT|nr:hypothetical protein [Labilibaculum filiforme]PKQ63819.1 hypothetical protein BZG02_07280 [Labilibaculum filiforme]
MNKIMKFVIALVLIGSLTGAQMFDFQRSDRKSNVLRKNEILKQKLWEQLQNGESALYDNAFDIETYKYTKDDYECLISYLKETLKEEGYNTPSKEVFAQKVRKIFGRTIDYSTCLKYLYVNMDNPKDRKHKYFRSDNSIEIHPLGIFVNKEYCFITQLYAIPEIIDYKKEFPEIYQRECKLKINQKDKNSESLKLSLWKDNKGITVGDNLKTFIARNRYLLNNDTTQLVWLLKHDELFMEALIKTYGYYENKKHVDWYNKRR